MSIKYSIIAKEVALRSAQLAGTSQSTLEMAYTAYTLDGAEVPASAIKAEIINIEGELSHIIASDPNHPYRGYIYGESAPLANLALTPVEDASGDPFIGEYDSVVDSTSGQPCTAQPTETLADYTDPFFSDTELYNYAMVGATIQHTRTAVKIQGCVFNRDTAETNYDANGDSPLPPTLANVWIAGVLANMGQVGWSDAAGSLGSYASLYQQGLDILRSGAKTGINLPEAAKANPVVG